MFASARRLIGNVNVTESQGLIRIQGIPTGAITNDIAKHWATSRMNSHMFVKLNSSELVIPSFFAVELVHMLKVLYEVRRIRTNRRAIEKILIELHSETWLRNIDSQHESVLDFSQLRQIKFKLLPHQLAFLERYNWVKPRYNLRGILLMVPPGGGKTISDISIAVCTEADIVYIVSPKNAIYTVWAKTLSQDMTSPQKVWIAADEKPFDPTAKWLIYHYETLDKAIQAASKHPHKKTVIILDESHGFNDIAAQRTEKFLELCRITKSTDIIWASGTPIKAMGQEAIPLIRSIDPLFTPDVEARFKRIFGANAERGYDILNHRLGLISYKVPKSEFMDSTPTFIDINVKMPNGDKYTLASLKGVMSTFITERQKYYAARKEEDHAFYRTCISAYYVPRVRGADEDREFREYQSIVASFIKYGFDSRSMGDKAKFCNAFERDCIIPSLPKDLKLRFIDVKSVVKYVDLKIRGECLGRILSKEREQCHVDMIDHIEFDKIIDNSEKKTLIFTSFVKAVDKAFNTLTNGGYAPLRVYGDTNSDLTNIIGQYRDNPDVNPLVATFQSLSSAVPLIMANSVIFLNSPFRSHEEEQAISRCNRLGQDKPVFVYKIHLDTGTEPNISTRSRDILEWSRAQVSSILGVEDTSVDAIALEDVYGGHYEDEYGDVSLCLESHQIVESPPPSLSW